MFIDTHCHLNFGEYADDHGTVLTNAKKAGVKKIIIPGASINSSRSAVDFTVRFPDSVYAAVGCHPYETTNYPDIPQLKSLIGPSVVAIGECGLDYHMYKDFPATGKKDEQKKLFEAHLALSRQYDLPVIIHCRDAFDDIFSVLDAQPSMPKGVFHCFSGGLADYREVEKREFFVGFDGNITYSKQLMLVIPHIPIRTMLLETDAPYLTPVPYRGTRNEPKYIPLIAQKIAELTDVSVDSVASRTTENAGNLFRL